MPTYEYGCTECGNEWEEVQRITASPTEVCPKCGKTSAHRLISAGTNFILKGGGWYSDLYSSSGGSKKKDEEAAKPASGDSATKTESAAKPSEPSTPTTPTTPTTPPTSAAA
jgi:putative FmdB family regulatory protein